MTPGSIAGRLILAGEGLVWVPLWPCDADDPHAGFVVCWMLANVGRCN